MPQTLLPALLSLHFTPAFGLQSCRVGAGCPSSSAFRAAKMPSVALGGDPGNMVSFLQAGIVSQEPNFLRPFECPKLGCSEEAAAAEAAGEETAKALGWCGSQLLTLVTDRPCHFLSCSPSRGRSSFRETMLYSAWSIPSAGLRHSEGRGTPAWMRSERPMVWCCFFVRAQVSSLQLSWGWTSSQRPPRPG